MKDNILRFADQEGIRNAVTLLEEITEAVNSFQTIASEIGISESVRSLIAPFIKTHTP